MEDGARTLQARYPGAPPFGDTDLDRRRFFGREREIDDLSYQIIGTQLLVLFARSGLGKTSLLQAGVFPRLREHDLLPIAVRLDEPQRDVLEVCLADIAEKCLAQGIDHTPGERGSLWEYFKTTALWRDGMLQTPVLVLDQFEEVFTLHLPEGRRRVAEELGQLLRGGLPDAVRARRERGESLPYSDKPPVVKVVLSLREDYLGHLEDLTAELPQILENRFRLTALSRDAASHAMVKPARLPQCDEHDKLLFRSPPFEYSMTARDEILDFLAGKSGEIEPFQLQLLCQHVEQKLTKPKATAAQDLVVDRGYLGGERGMQRILRAFYRTRITRIRGRWQRMRARRLCEDGLLSKEGRRLSLEEKQICRTYKLQLKTLQTLVEQRLLRQEPRLGSFYYEISHDSLAAPIRKARPWRIPRGLKRAIVVVLISYIFLSFIGVGLLELSREADRQREIAEQARDIADYILGKMIFDVRDELQARKQFDALEVIIDPIIEHFETVGSAGATPYGLNNRGAAYTTRALLNQDRGNLVAALADYKTAIGFLEDAAAGAPKEPLYLSNLSSGYERIGMVRLQRGELQAALAAFERARWAAERVPDDAERKLALADVQQRLGDVWTTLGNSDAALQAFEMAQSLAPELTAPSSNGRDGSSTQWDAILAYSSRSIASLRRGRGEHEAASQALEDAQKVTERVLSADDQNVQWLQEQLWIHLETGDLLMELGDHDRALRKYQRAEEIAVKLLLKEASNPGYRLAQAAVDDKLAEVYLVTGRFDHALGLRRGVRDQFAQLTRDFPDNVSYKDNLALTQMHLGYSLTYGATQFGALRNYPAAKAWGLGKKAVANATVRDHLNKARECYEAARQILEERTSQSPDDTTVQKNLAWTRKGLGDVGIVMDKGDDTANHYKKARDIFERLAALDRTNKNWESILSEMEVYDGRALLVNGRLGDANAAFQDALATQKRLTALDLGNALWQEVLAHAHDGLGDGLITQGEPHGPIREYQQAKTIRKHLIGIAPNNVGWELDYLASLYKLAMAGESAQQESQTLEGYRREIRDRLQKLNRDLRLPPIAQELSRMILASIERKMKKGAMTKANKQIRGSQLSPTP